MAEAFAREGAKLVLSARREEELVQVARRCVDGKRDEKADGTADDDVMVLPLDLAKADTFAALTEKVLARFGRVDVMVHNGGISQRALVKDTVLDVDRRIMEVNYFGTIALTKALLPSMLAAGTGHFVVISSVMGKIGTPQRSAYAASKHALHGFFDCLRAEIADAGLHVSLICPGYIRTDVTRNALTGDGTPKNDVGIDIESGFPPEATAKQILDVVHRRRSEAYVGAFGKERLALALKRFAPGVLERVARKAVPK